MPHRDRESEVVERVARAMFSEVGVIYDKRLSDALRNRRSRLARAAIRETLRAQVAWAHEHPNKEWARIFEADVERFTASISLSPQEKEGK